MISCLKCGKENQDHYKFCLGCGAELPRNQQRKLTFHQRPAESPPEPVLDEPTAVGQGAAVAAPPAPAGPVACPECGYENKPTNRFCASCGYRMQPLGATPASAAPAVAAAAPASPPAPAAPAEPVAPLPIAPAPEPAAVAMGDGPFAPPSSPGGGALPVASAESIAAAAVVVTALLADGSEAGHFPLPAGSTTVGRDTGSFFGGDGYLSPRHATITSANGTITVRDEGSLNGTFRKLDPDVPVELHLGDVIRIGQALLRVEPVEGKAPTADGVEVMGSPRDAFAARVALIVGRDTTANAFPIPREGLRLGRERGDILLSEDGYVSGLHCRIAVEGGKILLTDLGSSNGTFLRLRDETAIPSGQIVLMGQQLYRITLGAEFRG